MAEETKTDAKALKTVDYISKIGRNFNIKLAEELFGADLAVAAMDAVAAAGGYGKYKEEQYREPLFGGFAVPDPATVEGEQAELYGHIRAKINAALNALK